MKVVTFRDEHKDRRQLIMDCLRADIEEEKKLIAALDLVLLEHQSRLRARQQEFKECLEVIAEEAGFHTDDYSEERAKEATGKEAE